MSEAIPKTMFAWRKHRGNPEPVCLPRRRAQTIPSSIANSLAGVGRGSCTRGSTHGYPMQNACIRGFVLQLPTERAARDYADLTVAQCVGVTILSSPTRNKQVGSQTNGSWYVLHFSVTPQFC